MEHATAEELAAGLDSVRACPQVYGTVERVVCRPAVDEREEIEEGVLSPDLGLVGDSWSARPGSMPGRESPHPGRQITVMNARLADLVARSPDRWGLAGDQLYVDLDLSEANLPPGTRLAVGAAVIEVSAEPHLGCSKFASRFGREALRFVNSAEGRSLRLRGLNARVVTSGAVRVGDPVRKLE